MDKRDYADELGSAFNVTAISTITKVSGEVRVDELLEQLISDRFSRASEVEVEGLGYRKAAGFSFTIEEDD